MSDRMKETSVHFQLLIAETILFLIALFWVVIPQTADSGQLVNPEWCIIYGLSAIAVYLAFVVLVAGHALLEKQRERPPKADQLGMHDSSRSI